MSPNLTSSTLKYFLVRVRTTLVSSADSSSSATSLLVTSALVSALGTSTTELAAFFFNTSKGISKSIPSPLAILKWNVPFDDVEFTTSLLASATTGVSSSTFSSLSLSDASSFP